MFVVYLLRFLSFFPLSWIHRLADALGFLAFYLVKKRTHIALRNVALCFPEKPLNEQKKLVRRHLQNVCRMAFEYGIAWWGNERLLRRLVRVEGLQYLKAIQGRPCIVLGMHTTAMELCSLRFAMEHASDCFYRPQKDPHIDAMMRQGRRRMGDTVLLSKLDGGLRLFIKRLKMGRTVFFFPDQDFGLKNSIFVPFFGIPAATVVTVHRVAKAASAVILPLAMYREGHKFVLEIHPVWDEFPSSEYADGVRMNAWFESCIRRHPEDYFWIHRRFKTQENGQSYYDR